MVCHSFCKLDGCGPRCTRVDIRSGRRVSKCALGDVPSLEEFLSNKRCKRSALISPARLVRNEKLCSNCHRDHDGTAPFLAVAPKAVPPIALTWRTGAEMLPAAEIPATFAQSESRSFVQPRPVVIVQYLRRVHGVFLSLFLKLGFHLLPHSLDSVFQNDADVSVGVPDLEREPVKP
jgi:hypothetical protein